MKSSVFNEMENNIVGKNGNSVIMENGIAKSVNDLQYFHDNFHFPQPKLHKEYCDNKEKGILETLCRNINIVFQFFVLLLIFIWGLLIWFIGLFICTPKKDVAGQLALITGGANGFGRELCLRFALEGCDIAIADVDFENAKLVAEQIQRVTAKSAKAYRVNVGNPLEVEDLKQKIIEDFGRSVDILVNNAGLMPMTSFDDKTEVYENCINVNLMAHIWMIRAFLPSMISNSRGHIVAISSAGSFVGLRKGSIYCSSKAGVRTLMESLKDDLNMRNISGVHTSCVLPYFLATEGLEMDKFEFLIPPINPDKAAKILVDNILRNNLCFTIPRYYFWPMSLLRIMPEPVKYRLMNYMIPRFFGENFGMKK